MNKKLIISTVLAGSIVIVAVGLSTTYIIQKNKTTTLNITQNPLKSQMKDTIPSNNFQTFISSNPDFKSFLTLKDNRLIATPQFISALYSNPNSNGFIFIDNKEFHFNKDGLPTIGFLNNHGLKYFNKDGELETGYKNIDGNFYKFKSISNSKDSILTLENTNLKLNIPNLQNGNITTGELDFGNIELTFNDKGILDKVVNTKNNDTFSGQNLKSFMRKNSELSKYITLNDNGFVKSMSPVLAKALHNNPLSEGWIELGHCNYHFDINGNLTKGFYTNSKGITTYSNQYGEMDVGFKKIDNTYYYFKAQTGVSKLKVKVDNSELSLSVWSPNSGSLTKNASISSENINLSMGKNGELESITEK